MNELTLKELLNEMDRCGDVSGPLFLALLKHEKESAEFAVGYEVSRFHQYNSPHNTTPDHIFDDLESAMRVYAAFNTLLDYYSVPGGAR